MSLISHSNITSQIQLLYLLNGEVVLQTGAASLLSASKDSNRAHSEQAMVESKQPCPEIETKTNWFKHKFTENDGLPSYQSAAERHHRRRRDFDDHHVHEHFSEITREMHQRFDEKSISGRNENQHNRKENQYLDDTPNGSDAIQSKLSNGDGHFNTFVSVES